MKIIKIFLSGLPIDYPNSIFPILAKHLGWKIEWVKQAHQSDLTIYGPFFKTEQKKYRWLPKPLRPIYGQFLNQVKTHSVKRSYLPLTLFHTGESIRYDAIKADFSISFDLGVDDPTHFRFPYWMELVDWSKEGIVGNRNPRFGRLLSIDQMCEPLGKGFLAKPRKAAIITSHLLEPRKTLYKAVSKYIEIDGYGPYFNPSIKDHHQSGFLKSEILQGYAFNFCPENNLYPGYYTEKIPEAFLSGCLPITWVDSNVIADFNPRAFINLQPMTYENFYSLGGLLNSGEKLSSFIDEPLLMERPSIEGFKEFVREILRQATT